MEINLAAGWIAILAGLLTGVGLGLFFHKEEWLGGYNSWPRRMSPEELRQGFHRLARQLYGNELSNWRRETFARKYRRGNSLPLETRS